MDKKLSDILTLINITPVQGDEQIIITDVVYDSRKATPGSLFIALTGSNVDGHDYIKAALKLGAVAVIAERMPADLTEARIIQVNSTRTAMQQIAPYFFDYPAKHLKLIGVTGTNGKTTTTNVIYNILQAAGHSAAVVGTINTRYAGVVLPSINTTPDVVDMQRLLYDMLIAGVEYVVMEVSSHALALERVAGCEFDVAVLTNITQDHLDFHKEFKNYVQAKSLLFTKLADKENSAAVVNIDDLSAKEILAANVAPHVYRYALNAPAEIYPESYKLAMDHMYIDLITPQGHINCRIATTGLFNIYNIMASVAVAIHLGVDLTIIESALKAFKAVDGRFEIVPSTAPFTVIVDYAHTPDGLENVLKTAREITEGKLIVVFGCGGNRDKTKRPKMAAIAEQIADIVIITSDNPRKEDPQTIVDEVETGISKADTCYKKIVDRKTAIAEAIKLAGPQASILIAGKGHETYQILHDKTIDFDDRQVATDILKELGYVN